MKIVAVMAPVIAIIALFFAYGLSSWIGKMDEGTERMKEISGYIRKGAMGFLKREYKTMVIVILVLSVILGFCINWTTAVLYVMGAFFSISASLFGMKGTMKGSARTVSAAMNTGLDQALKIAIRSGAIMGLCIVSLGLLGIGGVFVVLGVKSVSAIAGFGLGASSMAWFVRIGSGVYKNAIDINADLAENAEAGIPADDFRNSMVIADIVGVNGSSVAGMGADLFESYVSTIISVIILASVTKSITPKFGYPFDLPALEGSIFPLILSAIGIIASVLGIMFVRGNENKNTAAALKTGMYISNTAFVSFSIILSRVFFGNFNCAISTLTGLIVGIIIGKITEGYTSSNSKHVKNILEQSQLGYAATILSGYGAGMLSTVWPVILISAAILAAHAFAGFYGIALAAVGMLSATGIMMTTNAFGSVSKNAHGIAQMTKLSDDVKTITERLDHAGKQAAAPGKVFSICSAAMASLALLISYSQITELKIVSIMKPIVLISLFLGAMLPFLFSALTMNSVGKVAHKMIIDIKKQFHSDTGNTAGTSNSNYSMFVDISTKTVIKEIVVPGFLVILVPLAVGILMGTEALAGMLLGSISSGILLAIMMTNTGDAWNNAKKCMEEGNYGEKGSGAHKVTVVGDMVGNPFKDTAGPSISILIKLMATVAVVFAPIFGGLL